MANDHSPAAAAKGMDAMASRHPNGTTRRLGQLWQMPLLLVSLGLFGAAAYLVIDRRIGPTVEQRIGRAAAALQNDRSEAALEQLEALEKTGKKLAPPDAARVHLLQAEALDSKRKAAKDETPARAAEIIEHTKAAVAGGIRPDAAAYRRLAECYEILNRPKDALANYRKAIDLDPESAPAVRRKVIDLQLARDDPAAAKESLAEYLKDARLSDGERLWAVGEQSRILVDEGEFEAARTVLRAAAQATDLAAQGQVNYRLAYCEWKLGNAPEAERLLRIARDQLRTQHPLDADAAQLLGKILQDRGEPRQAASFYQAVLTAHPDSPLVPVARLGRGVCRIEAGEDEPGLADLNEVVTEIDARPSRAPLKPEAVAGLRRAAAALADRGNYRGAVELLDLGLKLDPAPAADFYAQAGSACEKLADEIEKAAATSPNEADRAKRRQDVNTWRIRAGNAAMNYSERLTVSDDKGHAAALWRAVDLYEQAGDLSRAIAALELFIDERRNDPQRPEALLRVGRMYQVAGNFDKAIAAFQKNQFDHAQAVAASRSGVPLAQAYMAKGPAYAGKAEATLRATLESPLVTPDAEDFKNALFELAQLYYRNGRYEEAVGKLQEMTERYPPDGRTGQILFLMADSYRKSAALLKDGGALKPPTTAPVSGPAGAAAQLAARTEAAAERRDRLAQARRLFDKVIEQYRTTAPARDIDKVYLKLAHFYRADCLFDAGGYDEAIRLYDAAALRYQDDPAALTAYVQIVNAYCALGRLDEAKHANERAIVLLRRIPREAFKSEAFAMPKEYWENWLKWSGDAAMW